MQTLPGGVSGYQFLSRAFTHPQPSRAFEPQPQELPPQPQDLPQPQPHDLHPQELPQPQDLPPHELPVQPQPQPQPPMLPIPLQQPQRHRRRRLMIVTTAGGQPGVRRTQLPHTQLPVIVEQ